MHYSKQKASILCCPLLVSSQKNLLFSLPVCPFLLLLFSFPLSLFLMWYILKTSFELCIRNLLVSHSQSIRMMPEGLDSRAAFIGQIPPKRASDWNVNHPITVYFVYHQN